MSTYEISKSSLLSLKAEILRKQDDLTRAKLENVQKLKSAKKKTLEIKNKGVEGRRFKDLDDEEQDLLKLSRSKLEAKSKLYDKLSGKPQDDVNRQYLVRFEGKDKVPDQLSDDECEPPDDLPVHSEDEEGHLSDYYDEDIDDPSDEWVEYTDCLGRTRKCLRKDLEYVKSRDNDLKRSTGKPQQPNEEPPMVEAPDNNEVQNELAATESEMISGDMRRELLRKQWEKEEEELRNKTDIHYQNVLFNEARQHGVGYYAFSKDEDERAKQQQALHQIRLETKEQQKKASDLKALRDKQLAARMKAARNRKRARLGLPPEEDEPAPTLEPILTPEEEKKKQEEKEKLEQDEKLLMEARKRHLRPWDVGKEGTSEFYQMSQQEWNEKKRKERPAEFAPPTAYSSTREFSSRKKLECSHMDDGDKSLKFSTIGRKGNKSIKLKKLNPYKISMKKCEYKDESTSKDSGDISIPNDSCVDDDDDNDDCLMKDYMNSKAFTRPYEPDDPTSDGEDPHPAMSNKMMEPVPITNEVDETAEFDDSLLADYHKYMQGLQEDNRKRGVEIAPPPTFEYFGPTETKRARNSAGQVNIGDSIEAGLRFLREQAERKTHRHGDKNV